MCLMYEKSPSVVFRYRMPGVKKGKDEAQTPKFINESASLQWKVVLLFSHLELMCYK